MDEDVKHIIKDVEFVYFKFRKASAEFHNRGYRLPKDFESFLYNRMSKSNREKLIKLTKNFITKWERIDIEQYFRVGFKLFGKNFSYIKFLDDRIITLYKDIDKNLKRDLSDNKKKFTNSAKYVIKYIKSNNLSLEKYCVQKWREKGKVSLVINHYIHNYIDKIFVVWLIKKGYFYLNDDEKPLVPYIVDNYRDLYVKLDEMNGFIDKIERKMKNGK
jgi:hypothetical protein